MPFHHTWVEGHGTAPADDFATGEDRAASDAILIEDHGQRQLVVFSRRPDTRLGPHARIGVGYVSINGAAAIERGCIAGCRGGIGPDVVGDGRGGDRHRLGAWARFGAAMDDAWQQSTEQVESQKLDDDDDVGQELRVGEPV